MSIKSEQYRSLHQTRQFLRDLLTIDAYPKTKKEMRERAYRCLRHYPFLDSKGEPRFSRDGFECPVIGENNKDSHE